MRATSQTSKVWVWVWGAVAALAVGMVGLAAPANAAPPASSTAPVATASATDPVDDTVTVTSTVNRGAKQIRQVSCTLDGLDADCGTAAPGSTKKLTSYSQDLTELADGVHLFVVTFTLTDGGTAAAGVEFTIDAALQEACTTVIGGTVTYNRSSDVIWLCLADPYLGPEYFTLEFFYPFCPPIDVAGRVDYLGSDPIVAAVICYV